VIEIAADRRLVEIADVARAIRAQELAPATINRRLCVLKAAAKFAWRQGWTADNLSPRVQLVPEAKYRRREVTLADATLLIEKATTKRAKALIALSAYTGLRLGEVLKLRPADVKGGVIVARDTKNGTDRLIPILPELKPHLAQLPFKAGWRNVYRGFLRAREAAGLDIRYHDLRHMVASALARSQADLRLSMDIMGHRSVETHRRYVHTDLDARRVALAKALKPITPPIRKKKKAAKAA
jgi:integrase